MAPLPWASWKKIRADRPKVHFTTKIPTGLIFYWACSSITKNVLVCSGTTCPQKLKSRDHHVPLRTVLMREYSCRFGSVAKQEATPV